MPKKKINSRTDYKNKQRDATYDRIELILPLGTKDRLKQISSTLGISVNDYVGRLIKADLEKDHKHEDLTAMLLKWEVKEKYHSMIQSASFLPTTGYYIKLKKGFTNDHFGSDEILCATTREVRHVMQFTHPVRNPEEMCGLDSKTYEQLVRWQAPKNRLKDIASVDDHQIIFKDGTTWTFKSVSELRYMWKQSKEG